MNDDSTRIKILFTLMKKNKEMTLTEVTKELQLDKELVFHHLKKLKEELIIAEVDKKYICHSFFYDDDVMEDLNSLMKIIVRMILRELQSEGAEYTQEELEIAVKNNLELFIQTFAIEIME